jgi:hypothetical protein
MKYSVERTIRVKKRFTVWMRENVIELKSVFFGDVHIRLARWAIQRAGPHFVALIEHRWAEIALPPGREVERLANRHLT